MRAILDDFSKVLTEQVKCSVRGRIVRTRSLGAQLCFADISSNGQFIQVMSDRALARGDIVEISGHAVDTSSKMPTIRADCVKVLQSCHARDQLPGTRTGLLDTHLRERKRHLDLIMNSYEVFKRRSDMIRGVREFLWSRGFDEVETPILSRECGGALAEPFVTELGEEKVYMRIAPELFLKRCLIGGFERVFELGKVFRNEGLDATHQAEFTSLEFYWAYSNLEQVMDLTTELISRHADLGTPSKVDLLDSLEGALKCKLPPPDDIDHWRKLMEELCKQHQIHIRTMEPLHGLFDKLVAKFVEPAFERASVFLMNHPWWCSPLAESDGGKSKRFELFIDGVEMANGYEELRDPTKQLERFEFQARENGRQVSPGDLDYGEALKIGMPPATGCGIGIDRLVMKALKKARINDVVLFPL